MAGLIVRLCLIAVVAAVMPVVGLKLTDRQDSIFAGSGDLLTVVTCSAVMWLTFSLVLNRGTLPVAIYLGGFSSILWAFVLADPFIFLFVVDDLPTCIGVGVATGVLVALLSPWQTNCQADFF